MKPVAKKLALLIGVSEYGEGFEPLSAPPKDVAALQRVLQNPELGGFDQVKTLINPNPTDMRMEIETLFTGSTREDLILLFFSGHGITDDSFRLYLTTRLSSKASFRSTSVDARFIQDLSDGTYAKRQVIILDCCYSGAFAEGWQRKGDIKLELERELGKGGRVVLTSSSSTQVSFQQEDAELSLYTQYLVEGIETGAADTDQDGTVKVRELHDYAKRKVREVKPKMQPDIIVADDEGYDILLSRVKRDAASQFRQLVEKYADHNRGEIRNRRCQEILDQRARELQLTSEEAAAIITSVLEPSRRRLKSLERYRQEYEEEAQRKYPLDKETLEDLRDWQQSVLGLEDRDVEAIQREVNSKQEQKQAEKKVLVSPVSPTLTPVPSPPRQPVSSPTPPQLAPRTLPPDFRSRRNVLKWVGFSGGGLLLATVGRQWVVNSLSPIVNSPELAVKQLKTAQVNAQGEVIAEPTIEVNAYEEVLADGITLTMVEIPGGTFWMGQTEAEKQELIRQVGEEKYQQWYARELPRHQVTISSFFMGKFPVTQAQYEAVMGENPATQYDRDRFVAPDKPMVGVTWHDAVAFCDRLSQQTGRTYRLPSEAEWEYACRAETETPFHFGETITTDLANYRGIDWEWEGTTYPGNYGTGPKGSFREQTTTVASFPANAFGLFDMHGNVWEWCLDHWHNNYQGAPTDGSAWNVGGNSDLRIRRGGSWGLNPRYCRSACRSYDDPGFDYDFIGFRVVCGVP